MERVISSHRDRLFSFTAIIESDFLHALNEQSNVKTWFIKGRFFFIAIF